MIIGLTGTKASGKGMVAKYLVSMGFNYISLSDIVREEARKNYEEEPDAEALSKTGDCLREKEGWGVLAKMASERIGRGDYAVDGIRHPAEVEALRKLPGFFLISIDADRKLRYDRIAKRGRPDDPKTFEDFLALDEEDKGVNEPPGGHKVLDTMALSDFKIDNNFGLDKLHKRIDEILSKVSSAK
ncbi:MAG: AAA family ATPase [Candidatus Aenigmarchaeota archaeon]|nr:AAA family ATPase [Candidatus Aenigmarchaeota archaeon]